MTWWEITLWSIPAALPGWIVWRWRARIAAERAYRESKEYRRRKFGGVIKVPGHKDVVPLDPPEGR